MWILQHSWILLASFILCMVDSRGIAGNVKLVAMNGNQYWFSTSSPYAPTLNFHLAYQYCRTLGLQLAVLETTEEVETISAYLNKDANPINHKYWTSGNKLGSDSWIWMSSGEQLNSSFTDYWLKNGVGVGTTDNPRHCMSMKPPISPTTKRAIFTAEECNKSLPFICEQVRCLYYNYPVMMFPDPSELRADIEDGTSANPAESESREKIRTQNLISGNRKQKQLSVSDIIVAESGGIDNSKIQPRMILRPVMSTYPMPSYVNSFHKYKATEYTPPLNSKRTPFKKTNNEHLWGPPSLDNNDIESTTQINSQIINTSPSNFNKKHGITRTTMKPITFITGKNAQLLNATSKPSSYPPSIKIVTSKTATIDGKELTEAELEDDDEDEDTAATMLYHRYGTGNNPTEAHQIFASGYVSTDSSVAFDDEQNNVGGEVEIEETTTIPKYFQGSGIRHPDMTLVSKSNKNKETLTELPSIRQNFSSFYQTTTKSLQKNKSQISWSNKAKTSAAILPNTNTGQETMGLGSRLKLRLKSN